MRFLVLCQMAHHQVPSTSFDRVRDRARAFLHRQRPKAPRTEEPWTAPSSFPDVEPNPSRDFQILWQRAEYEYLWRPYKPKQKWHQIKKFMLKHGYKIYKMPKFPRTLHWVQTQDHRMLRGARPLRFRPGGVKISYDSAGLWQV